MNDNDRGSFAEIYKALVELYNVDAPSDMAMSITFRAFSDYSLEQIQGAVSCHIADPKHGTFFPKPADIIRHIQGGEVTHDHVIASARLAKTPLGILCRIQIGTFDLDNSKDQFYMKSRAQECIDLLPEWRERAILGDYSDHEISIMVKHSVSPCAPFDNGLQKPSNQDALMSRVNDIIKTPRHQFLLEKPHKEQEGDKALVVSGNVAEFIEGKL